MSLCLCFTFSTSENTPVFENTTNDFSVIDNKVNQIKLK